MTITPAITPIYTSPCGAVTLYQGEALAILPDLPTAGVDALITDPPYSSGAFTRSDRTQPTNDKYTQQGTKHLRPDFGGDSRSQRGWAYWSALWLSECHRIVRPGGIGMTFTDWRQLASAGDAFEAGGWLHRATMVWDKGRSARAPHTGYPRHQSEFILFGSHGPFKPATHGGPWDGVITCPVLQSDKHHTTGKPTRLMERLVEMTPPGATILDPFAGSGTTAIAAINTGRRAILIEKEEAYVAIAIDRIEAALAQRQSERIETLPQQQEAA